MPLRWLLAALLPLAQLANASTVVFPQQAGLDDAMSQETSWGQQFFDAAGSHRTAAAAPSVEALPIATRQFPGATTHDLSAAAAPPDGSAASSAAPGSPSGGIVPAPGTGSGEKPSRLEHTMNILERITWWVNNGAFALDGVATGLGISHGGYEVDHFNTLWGSRNRLGVVGSMIGWHLLVAGGGYFMSRWLNKKHGFWSRHRKIRFALQLGLIGANIFFAQAHILGAASWFAGRHPVL